MNELVLLIGLFLGLCFLRVPIAFAITGACVVTLLLIDVSLRQVATQFVRSLDLFPLLAIPLYIFAANVMNSSDLTERLINLARAMIGHIRGGLAHMNILTSMMFGGISGSSTADAAGIGSVMIPSMTRAGYPVAFSVVVTAMSSTMGNIIPPSIYMIVYGSLSGVSIGALFLGGAVPGILIGLTQLVLAYHQARVHGYPAEPPMSTSERLSAFWRAAPAVAIPVFVIGGITSGIFSPTEAAAALVVYCLVMALVVYRSLRWRDLPGILSDSAMVSAMPLFTIASSSLFGWLIGYLNGPDIIADHVLTLTSDPTAIALMMIAFLLVVGTFLSEVATIIIFLPVIQKMGDLAGLDPVHLGVIVVIVLCAGLVTPPYGLCLLIASDIGRISVLQAFRTAIPYFVLFLAIVLVLLFVPELVLWLPQTLMPQQ